LSGGFESLGLPYIPSVANFITVRVGNGGKVFAALQKTGVIVRPLGSYGMSEWVRVSVGTLDQNDRVLRELGNLGLGNGEPAAEES
jgi:histidinol-phosphate aminotransferase